MKWIHNWKINNLYVHTYRIIIYIWDIYIYMPGPSLSRIIFDLCGFSGAGLKITFGLGVMDSMTQFCCQKVGLSRLFCVILGHIFGPSQIKSAIVRLSPPFNPGIFGGGKARNFWEILRLTTWNILYPPTCFFGFEKTWGGSSGCHILAQRWYDTPFHFA